MCNCWRTRAFTRNCGISKAVSRSAATAGMPVLAPDVDTWVGRNHTPLDLSHEIKVVAPVAFSFNGIIDEVKLYNTALSAEELVIIGATGTPPGDPQFPEQ